jgi:RimJ/RimL family protein N-acetyltransferase
LKFAFEKLKLNRVQARHFSRNPASGRVMQKMGMQREGILRQAVKKWDRFEDLELYSILKSEWEARR